MADSVSETDVKNLALALVGEEPITSGTDQSKAQKHSKLLYKFARNIIFDLRVDWRFCEGRATIAAHADEPLHGSYDYQFVFPSMCRRVRKLQESTDDETEYKFRREVLVKTTGGRDKEYDVFLANIETAYITYTRLRIDTNSWPAYFAYLVAVRLAILLCEPLKQDKRKKEQLRSMYQDALADAKAGNGAEDADVSDEYVREDKGNNDVLNAAAEEDIPRRYIINRPT